MDTCDRLTDELHCALRRLHDSTFEPSEFLCSIIGCGPEYGPARLQSAIVRSIHSLKPGPNTPPDARSGLLYQILYQRYVVGLTQEQTSDLLHTSVRQLNRLQREATHLLAQRLWGEHLSASPPDAATIRTEDWQVQVRQDLKALTQHGDAIAADLRDTIRNALPLVKALARGRELAIHEQQPCPTLTVKVHPAALRQIILAILGELINTAPFGEISYAITLQGHQALVRMETRGSSLSPQVSIEPAQELLSACGGSVDLTDEPAGVSVMLRLPVILPVKERYTVLAIDDNVDLISLFASYCTNTPYNLVHIREGSKALAAIERYEPDLILLDVMLPDTDGWDLLQQLRANPSTRPLPVIVCSVIADEQLALVLGAAIYLRKPVWRQQMLDAFSQVLNLAAT